MQSDIPPLFIAQTIEPADLSGWAGLIEKSPFIAIILGLLAAVWYLVKKLEVKEAKIEELQDEKLTILRESLQNNNANTATLQAALDVIAKAGRA